MVVANNESIVIASSDAIANYSEYMDYLMEGVQEGYAIEIQGKLNSIDPLYAVKMLRNNLTIDEKAELCCKLIAKHQVTITLFGEHVIEFVLPNENAEFFAYSQFHEQPTALQFLLSAVYGEFLKNSIPQLNDSQAAARDQAMAGRKKEIIEEAAGLSIPH